MDESGNGGWLTYAFKFQYQTQNIMRITKIEIFRLKIKLSRPFIISLGPKTHADNVVVKITTDSKLTGFGECSPSTTINGENAETCFAVAGHLAKHLTGESPLDIPGCMQIMDSLFYGNTSIKSAFDIAIHDIASQHAGMPLYAFLGGKNNKRLHTDYTISLDDANVMVADALDIKDRGFPFIKVKLGDNRENDVDRIRRITAVTGNDIPLRLDANQGWDKLQAIGVLNDLADCNIQYCEEPIPRWDFMSLPEVTQASPIPVMADESCFDHHDADRLIKLGACDYINIKLGKSSGLYKARKIAGISSAAGIKMMVGGFVETRLAFTASAHLSLSNDHIVFSDFDSPMMMVEDPVSGGIVYGKGGLVEVPESNGLGAWIDDSYLKSLPSVVIE